MVLKRTQTCHSLFSQKQCGQLLGGRGRVSIRPQKWPTCSPSSSKLLGPNRLTRMARPTYVNGSAGLKYMSNESALDCTSLLRTFQYSHGKIEVGHQEGHLHCGVEIVAIFQGFKKERKGFFRFVPSTEILCLIQTADVMSKRVSLTKNEETSTFSVPPLISPPLRHPKHSPRQDIYS